MKQETLERRLDLLKLEGNGLLPAEITKELSEKYGVTRRTVQYDFKKKPEWQPRIEELEQVYLKIINRNDQLYRKASFQYSQVYKDDHKTSILVLNLMRNLNRDMYEFAKSTGYQPASLKPISPRKLEWVDPPEWKQKQYLLNTDHTQDKPNSTSIPQDLESSLAEEDGAKPKQAQTKR